MARPILSPGQMKALVGVVTGAIPTDLTGKQADSLIRGSGRRKLQGEVAELLRRSSGSWLDRLVAAESKVHRAFFGQTFDLTQFRATLEHFGEERVNEWGKLGLEPHFLPRFKFTPDLKLHGWKIKPEAWFWQQVVAGKIMRRDATGDLVVAPEVGFDGETVLIDTRCKPAYNNGQQMFANDDLLGPLIEALREKGKIARYEYGEQQTSRFGISSQEWDKHICPALQALPVFSGVVIRLETAIEANIIPQIYKQIPREKDGTTNTWAWYEECFEGGSYRLDGGDSGSGGLAFVHYGHVGVHWRSGAFRPLGVLDT